MSDKKILESCKDFVYPGSDGVMPVIAYHCMHGPFTYGGETTPDYMQEKYYKWVADAGINYIVSPSVANFDYINRAEHYKESLALSEKYGIREFIKDSRVTADLSDKELSDTISEYASHKAFGGIYVVDEPATPYFPRNYEGVDQTLVRQFMDSFAPKIRKLNSYENMCAYVNLLPYYEWMECGLEEYDRYIKEFCETCNPKYLAFDNYLFGKVYTTDTIKDGFSVFFRNFSIIYKYAKFYNIDIWPFVQSGGNWGENGRESEFHMPTGEETEWVVNICLAYGSKAIQYFPLLSMRNRRTDGTFDRDRHGLISEDGRPTRYLAYATTANEQVRLVGSTLLKCKSEGLIVKGEFEAATENCPEFFENDSFRQLKSVEYSNVGTIIGCLDYEGKTALYVVNNNMTRRQTITLKFDGEQSYSLSSIGISRTDKGDTCEVTLMAGRAALVVLE